MMSTVKEMIKRPADQVLRVSQMLACEKEAQQDPAAV